MANMLHAGSTVQKGSARAIVTAIGNHTYLGAMTGGFQFGHLGKIPSSIRALRKKCTRWNTVLLLTILPLSIISLLIGHFFGGTILLSTAFLTYMSVVATGFSHMVCTILLFYYTQKCRYLIRSEHPSAIRSAEALEGLASMDYLFIRDEATLSDGIMHFSSVMDSDGNSDRCSREFEEMLALYYMASTESLSTSVIHSSKYSEGIAEFLHKKSVDIGALRIRYRILSYLSGNLTTEEEKLCIESGKKKIWISVSSSINMLRRCVSEKNLVEICNRKMAENQVPLIFRAIANDGTDHTESRLLGILFLKEGIDKHRIQHIKRLDELGCRVILFSDPRQSPYLPCLVPLEQCMSKYTLATNNLPLSFQFGAFRQYKDFQSEDIEHLIQFLHAKNKKVAVLGFSKQSDAILRSADLMISCAPIHESEYKGGTWELTDFESSGNPHSTTCTQIVKECASVLIPRPSKQGGGLASLIHAIISSRRVYSAISDFLTYILPVQVIRMMMAILPMIMGRSIIDSRHILFCSCIMDSLAFFIFLKKAGSFAGIQKKGSENWNLERCKSLILASAICSACALLIPYAIDFSGIFGPYLYKTEYLFLSMISLHLTVLISVIYPSVHKFRAFAQNYLLVAEFLFSLLFILFCYFLEPVGILFAVEKCPFPYALAAILPSLIFVPLYIILNMKRKKQSRK